uniref:Lung adenoma susceptibility protein 2-like n=1 Tax=Sinocyclocheilus anshuiensis TaxID=1608454 RepID=A0A671QXE7_9TELE
MSRASEDGLMSPESSVTSLLATSGLLQSSLHPEPVPSIKYRDRHYASASEALDAYITDFQRSLRGSDTTTGKLHAVLKTSLTDEELIFLNIPVRNRDSDRLSMATDDLLALPNDGSLPVTRTSALLSRSGSFPLGLSFNCISGSHLRPVLAHKHCMRRPVPPVSRTSLPVDHIMMGGLQSHGQAPPPNILPANRTVPELKYPSIAQCSLRELRLQSEQKLEAAKRGQIHEGQLFKEMLPWQQTEKEHNSSGDTEDALDADRSWDNPPVMFKSPVPVGGAEEPPAPEELQRSKSAASCSSGYSSRKHPGPVEALKHMLFRLQAVEHKISQSHASGDAKTTASSQETEESDLGNVESLQRALHHLDRLKTLVDDMNERKARAEDDGIDCTDTPATNITDWTRINKQL